MHQRTEAQREEEYRQATQWAVKRRWVLTAVHLLLIGGVVRQIAAKRFQWHLLLTYPPVFGLSLWRDIIDFMLVSSLLIEIWIRIFRYWREQDQVEQQTH